MTEEKKIAEFLHKKLCRLNHIDGCGWFYRQDDWTDYSHTEYLKASKSILRKVSKEELIKIINILKEHNLI